VTQPGSKEFDRAGSSWGNGNVPLAAVAASMAKTMEVTLGIRVRSWKRSKKVVGVINDTVKPTLRRLNYLTHRFVSKSLTCAKLCVRLRNQANCIVGYHLGESPDSAMNGEYRLLDFLAPRC